MGIVLGVSDTRQYLLERVDDTAVVQVYADGFTTLPLRDKILAWHLYLAALAGRDIYYDQRHALNLDIRDLLEAILRHAQQVEPVVLAEIRRYTKLFWINTGPFNNLTARKFVLKVTRDQLAAAIAAAARAGARFDEPADRLLDRLAPMLFDPSYDAVVTSKNPGHGRDILEASANNLYVDVRMSDLDGFDERYGLNSRLVKGDGRLVEEVYKVGGKYDRDIRAIIGHLEDALPYASAALAASLRALIRFYRTGEKADRVAYDIAWVGEQSSQVDTINGFVEVYMDPRGMKGAWEAIVYYVNEEKTQKIQTLAAHAQWFEDRMPWEPRFRKPQVLGITARAIDVVVETGDSGPVAPLGINLPNDQAIRERYGSKSVSLSNVGEAYDKSTLPEFRSEFAWSPDEVDRATKWSAFAGELTTNMHEVIGHASGKVDEKLKGSPQAALKEQFSALEEARADLVALYFLPDQKLAEIGLVSKTDQDEIVRTEYEGYARNAIVQLRRVRQGTTIAEDHMRNRQMIVNWLKANTKSIDVRSRDGKTYYVLTDVRAFRDGAGRLLAEVQRIKAEGDYAAAKQLFETHGVHFDPMLRDEVVARVEKLQLPSYTGFVMPKLEAAKDGSGAVTDVTISYPQDLTKQMLEYAALTRGLRR